MEYNLDKPIDNIESDLLNRGEFAKHFAKNIVMLSEKDNFTVSLNGTWGSGKTSLINLIKKEIIKLRNDTELTSFPIILDFAPWNSLNENGIITQFFKLFSSNLIANKIKTFLKDSRTQFAFNLTTKLPIVGKYFKTIKNLINEYMESFLEERDDLLNEKNKIAEHLKKLDYNFIIFIDDIDRLNNKEIKLLFQLIKAVCDFPNVTYVLSFDKEIVANALRNEQTENGYIYLEKIIQLSIDIPDPLEEDLQNYLLLKLNSIIRKNPEWEFDETRWSCIFRNGFYNYFKNLRNINRYINAILFKSSSYKNDLNLLDFLTMEAISLFEPQLLNFIKVNKNILCKPALFDDAQKEEVKELRIECDKISNNFNLLKYLFPYLNTNTWDFDSVEKSRNYNSYKSNGRICYNKYFNFYFAGRLDKDSISRADVVKIIKSSNKTSIENYFKTLNNKTFPLFLQYLTGYIKDSKYTDEILNIMPYIVSISKDFKNLSELFTINKDSLILGILNDIFEIKGSENYFIWLKSLFNSTDNYIIMIKTLYYLTKNTSIYFKSNKELKSFLTEKQILELHNILVQRLNVFIYDDDFIKNYEKAEFIKFLSIKNENIVKKWINKQKSIDINLIFLIGLSAIYGYGESSKRFVTYNFPFKQFSKYINVKVYQKKIKNLMKSENIKNIPDNCKMGLILFIMPENLQEPYQKEDIDKFCKDNNIDFSCKEIFVDI